MRYTNLLIALPLSLLQLVMFVRSFGIVSRSRFGYGQSFLDMASKGSSRTAASVKKVQNLRVDRILVNRGMNGRRAIQKMIKEGRVLMVVDPNDPSKDVIIKKKDQKIPGVYHYAFAK